ncbi:MAG: hypothetical protein AAF386_05900 [Pseudomonadota bacterium]
MERRTEAEYRKRVRWDQFLKDMNWGRTTGYRKVKEGVIPKPHKIGAFNYLYADEAEAALQAQMAEAEKSQHPVGRPFEASASAEAA